MSKPRNVNFPHGAVDTFKFFRQKINEIDINIRLHILMGTKCIKLQNSILFKCLFRLNENIFETEYSILSYKMFIHGMP